jgi:hypothetical protein
MAQPNLQTVLFGNLPVCHAAKDVVTFKGIRPATQITDLIVLHNAFHALKHSGTPPGIVYLATRHSSPFRF